MPDNLTAKDLKRRFEEVWSDPEREWYHNGVETSDRTALRIHRAISWVERAEQETDDGDAKFIFYWIAFNAAYAQYKPDNRENAFNDFGEYFYRIVEIDRHSCRRISKTVWDMRDAPTVKRFLRNRFVFQPYWDCRHSYPQPCSCCRECLHRKTRNLKIIISEGMLEGRCVFYLIDSTLCANKLFMAGLHGIVKSSRPRQVTDAR